MTHYPVNRYMWNKANLQSSHKIAKTSLFSQNLAFARHNVIYQKAKPIFFGALEKFGSYKLSL